MKMEQISSSFVSDLTAYNSHIQFYGHDKWKAIVSDEIKSFQQDLFKAIKNGYDGKSNVDQKQWSFSGSFLYSLTVISTIGKFVFVLKHKKKMIKSFTTLHRLRQHLSTYNQRQSDDHCLRHLRHTIDATLSDQHWRHFGQGISLCLRRIVHVQRQLILVIDQQGQATQSKESVFDAAKLELVRFGNWVRLLLVLESKSIDS